MTGKAHAVLWLGFLLIGVRLFTTGQWSAIWGALSNGSPVNFGGGSGSSGGGGSVGKSAGDLAGAGFNLATGNVHGAYSDAVNAGSNLIYNGYDTFVNPNNPSTSSVKSKGSPSSNLIQGSVSP